MNKLKYLYQEWRLSQIPFFAICLDCGKKGRTKRKFVSLLSTQVVGKLFTGAGTCIRCASYQSGLTTF